MLRIDEGGERIPLTFSDWSAEEGWIRFIFMRVGKTTHELSHLEVGDSLADVVGPLGVPTHVEGLGRVAVVGGGVGAAVAYPGRARDGRGGQRGAPSSSARATPTCSSSRTSSRALPLDELVVMTDDGSAGGKGLVTAPLKELCEAGAIDHAFAIGPGDHDEVLRGDHARVRRAHDRLAQPDHGRRHRACAAPAASGRRRDASSAASTAPTSTATRWTSRSS